MRGDGGAKFRQAHHRRILVPAVDHRFGRLGAHVLRSLIVGKALAEIDRLPLARQPRHDLEDARLNFCEYRVHACPSRRRETPALLLAPTPWISWPMILRESNPLLKDDGYVRRAVKLGRGPRLSAVEGASASGTCL